MIETLLHDAGTDTSPAAFEKLKQNLATCLAAFDQKVAEVETSKAELECLTKDVRPRVVDALRSAIEERGRTQAEAFRDFAFDGMDLAFCAARHCAASEAESFLVDVVAHLDRDESPRAYRAALHAEWQQCIAREAAIRAEGVLCALECVEAAKPLIEKNGGSIELLLQGGRLDSYAQLLAAAARNSDAAKAAYDAEIAKQGHTVSPDSQPK